MPSIRATVASRVRQALPVRGRAGSPPPAPAPAAAKPSPAERKLHRFYFRVGQTLLPERFSDTIDNTPFEGAAARDLVERVRHAEALAVLGERLSAGDSIEAAHVAAVRSLIAVKSRHTARALTLALAGLRGGRQAHDLGLGLVTHSMQFPQLAWTRFRNVSIEALAEHAPIEAVESALTHGSDEAVAVAAAVAARSDLMDTGTLAELSGRFVAVGQLETARNLVEEVERRGVDDLDPLPRLMVENSRRWTHPDPTEAPPEGVLTLGVIDYHQPDYERSSMNVGDYVQTLAMLGNVARFQSLKLTGAHGLGELGTEIQTRVRPELRLRGPEREVNLMAVSRDFSEGDPIPPGTWMIAFGWHMHGLYKMRFGLPYHPHINPIFVSFHINRVGVLDEATIAYLREHGPIGCRDWATVDLLLSAGVDAFFTGCLTTTSNTLFPRLEDVDRSGADTVGVVDLPASVGSKIKRRPVDWMTNAHPRFRQMDVAEGTYAAIDILEDYQRRIHRLITSRLHVYLPATTLGLEVDFRPRTLSDVRFEGLLDMTPDAPALEAMRTGIRDLIGTMLELVLADTPKEEIYAHWREITADRVAEARARFEAPPTEWPAQLDVDELAQRLRESEKHYGPTPDPTTAYVDIALSLDYNFRTLLPTTVESILANASGPVRLWITTRGLDETYFEWFAAGHPDVPITFLQFDDVEYGEITRMIKHISVTTMDRLLLPEVLRDVDRLVYIDIDTVTEGDVCELASVDLQGFALAARSPAGFGGSMLWRTAGNNLDPELATELRRIMAQRHPFDFETLNAGVLVLDLARMRSDRFAYEFLPMVARFGLNDQDILNAYVGANRLRLDDKWNALPVQEEVIEPGIVHYAGAGKPWGDELVPHGEHWKAWEAKAFERLGTPPS